MRRAVIALAVIATMGCAPRARTATGDSADGIQVKIALPVEELDLPNGLHVVLHQERSASAALVHVRYHVGSKDDPQGRSGFAHLYEHLMFRGSRNTGTKDDKQWLEDVGGDSNAYTTPDATDYHAQVPPSALPRAIWLEADRMAYPLAGLDESGFAQERDVVKNEWREHYEDVPLGNLDAIARDAVFGADHPYGTSTIGRGDELDKATLQEARAFGGLYYRPNNATLVVCGAIDVAATRALVTRYFGTVKPGAPQRSRTFDPPSPPRAQKITVVASVDGPAVVLAWPAPGTHGDGFEELAYGFAFFGSSVRHRLITELKIANDVDTSYDHGRLGGFITITVKLKPQASVSSALGTLDEYLVQASRLGRLYPWDSFGSHKTRALVSDPDSVALDVLAAATAGDLSTRLNITVRKELGASYGVQMSAVGLRDAGIIRISAAIDTPKTVDAMRGLLAELQRLRTEPLSDAELGAAKLRTSLDLDGGSTRGLARYLARAIAQGLPPAHVVTHNARVDVVTAEAVRAAAERYLARDDARIVVVGDASRIVDGL